MSDVVNMYISIHSNTDLFVSSKIYSVYTAFDGSMLSVILGGT